MLGAQKTLKCVGSAYSETRTGKHWSIKWGTTLRSTLRSLSIRKEKKMKDEELEVKSKGMLSKLTFSADTHTAGIAT